MKKLKLKIITGFRENQYYTIDVEEAHKAYYLFLHPEERGVFDNGVALVGKNIQGIEPDYHATMGWNPSYKLEAEDWNEIKKERVDRDLRAILLVAKQTAQKINETNKSELLGKRDYSQVRSLPERTHTQEGLVKPVYQLSGDISQTN